MGCLIKPQSKNSTHKQFFKGVVHEQPWFSIVCLLWWFIFVSSCCLGWQNQTVLLSFSFAKVFFTFLVPFFWNSQECLISQNIGCLIQTQLKTAPKQFFKGVVHEKPWSSIVCLVWGPLLCPAVVWGENFQNHSLLSFSFPLLIRFSFFTFLAPFFWNSQNV